MGTLRHEGVSEGVGGGVRGIGVGEGRAVTFSTVSRSGERAREQRLVGEDGRGEEERRQVARCIGVKQKGEKEKKIKGGGGGN